MNTCLLCKLLGHAWQDESKIDKLIDGKKWVEVSVRERRACRRCGQPNPERIPSTEH